MDAWRKEVFIQILQEMKTEIDELEGTIPLVEFKKRIYQIKFKAGLKYKKIMNCKQIKKSHKRNYHGNI